MKFLRADWNTFLFLFITVFLVVATSHRALAADGRREYRLAPGPESSIKGEWSESSSESFDSLMSRSSVTAADESRGSLPVNSLDLFSPSQQTLHRLLQQGSNTNTTTPSPDAVCSNYNTLLKGQMNCTCARFDKTDVSVSCVGLGELCNSDQSWCAVRNIALVLDQEAKARSMLSCTNVTRQLANDPPLNSCVQVMPAINGDFTNLTQCYAVLNDKQCSCTTSPTCPATNVTSGNGTNNTAANVVSHIGVNCCQVQEGAYASCLGVVQNGAVLVLYDAPPKDGKCPQSSASVWKSVWWVGAWSSAILLWGLSF